MIFYYNKILKCAFSAYKERNAKFEVFSTSLDVGYIIIIIIVRRNLMWKEQHLLLLLLLHGSIVFKITSLRLIEKEKARWTVNPLILRSQDFINTKIRLFTWNNNVKLNSWMLKWVWWIK